MSSMELLKRVIIKDKDGKIVSDSGLTTAHSCVIAFLEHIYVCFADDSHDIEDVGNASQTVPAPSTSSVVLARVVPVVATHDTHGVVVGTGSTAVVGTDYVLDTQIAHGIGAGQLQYGGVSLSVPAISGSNVDMNLTRTFSNASGASITVNEIGVYSYNSGVSRYFCLVRDVLSTPAVVANGQTLTVQYTFRTTV